MNKFSNISPARILEHASFFETPVALYFSAHTTLSHGIIGEVREDCFAVLLQNSISSANTFTVPVKFVMKYKGQALNFSCPIFQSTLTTDRELWFKFPTEFFLLERRKSIRADLTIAKVKLRIELVTLKGTKKIKYVTDQLIYLSQDTIGICIPNGDNVLVPGDKIIMLRVFRGDKLVLISQGTVSRITSVRTKRQAKQLYVIAFVFGAGNSIQPGLNFKDRRIDNRRKVVKLIFPDKRIYPARDRRKLETQAFITDKRISDRRMKSPMHSFIEFSHPIFSNFKIFGEIEDISTSGLCFSIKSLNFPILPGMIIDKIIIHLPKCPVYEAKFRVLSVREIPENEKLVFRIGGDLIGLPTQLLKELSTKFIQDSIPNITEASIQDHDQLWEFFFETGFIYKSKQEQMKNNAHKIYDTSLKLLSPHNPIAKIVLFKEFEEIKGHISTIRCFDSSWIIQHLSAKGTNDALAGHALIDSMSAFFRNPITNNILKSHYIVFFYRPDNIYPAAVFDGVKEFINDKNICDSSNFHFCLPKIKTIESLEINEEQSGIITREANENDLRFFSQILPSYLPNDIISSEDLFFEKLTKLDISRDFQKLNLYRYRRVFVANDTQNGTRIFAVCNYTSPGINLSELTNSFRIFSLNETGPNYEIVLKNLVDVVISSYGNTDVKYPVLLLSGNQRLPMQYFSQKAYTHWRLDIRHVDKFKKATDAVFANIKRLVKEKILQTKQIQMDLKTFQSQISPE